MNRLDAIRIGDEIVYLDHGVTRRGTVDGWHLADFRPVRNPGHMVLVADKAIPIEQVISRKRGAGTITFEEVR